MRILTPLIPLLLLLSCERAPPIRTTEFTGTAMTIDYRIIIGSPLTEEKNARIDLVIQKTFEEINAVYNKWNPESELSRLNRLPANTTVQLSPKLHSFFLLTDRIVHLSRGRFDPTIEPLQSLWKNHLAKGSIPSNEEIENVKPAIGWNRIHFNDGVFFKDNDATMIDLGGIAKGYAVDLLTENLVAEELSSIYVEWGGEIRTYGRHPQNRPWKIYISRFEDANPNNAIAFVELENQALATSGDYLQHWTVDGISYFHILDPNLMTPLQITGNSIGSASVALESCAMADGLATAALTFSTEREAVEWLEQLKTNEFPEMRYWLLSRTDRDPF